MAVLLDERPALHRTILLLDSLSYLCDEVSRLCLRNILNSLVIVAAEAPDQFALPCATVEDHISKVVSTLRENSSWIVIGSYFEKANQ